MAHRGSFTLLLACFLLSGMAGLVYQTAWTQQFALVFGTSELAVATLLAAYMAGLMAGASIAARWIHRIRRPVWAYALLELGIALSALGVPLALQAASRLQVLVIGGLDVPPEAGSLGSALFYLLAAFVILALPTAFMGATLPLLARQAIRKESEIGSHIGLLYTANTLGAAGGVVLAAFLLLPWLGLGRTVWVAVGLNVLVFFLALLLGRQDSTGSGAEVEARAGLTPGLNSDAVKVRLAPILPFILISGIVSFTWEVLWIRLLSHLLGGSIYAFGTMLATFLVGIAIGSAVASRLATDARRARRGFSLAQMGIALCSLAAFLAIDRFPAVAKASTDNVSLLPEGPLLAALALLPGALFIGATFPFAVRILAAKAREAGPASARVYAWNTCGAILGAVGTGFFLLPVLRIAGTATLAIALSLLLALGMELSSRPRRRGLIALALVAIAGLALFPPPTPWRVLRTSPLSAREAQGDVVFYETGRSATVLLMEQAGQWRLTTNGLPESAIQFKGALPGRFTIARWLSLLPIASRPETESMLIVGLGAGLTLDSVPKTVREIHLVELEPEVIRANQFLSQQRRSDPLRDPRLKILINDARGALALTDRRFDAIVSQPSHPWTAGASHLFTREFFTMARQHLNPGGVFVQWIGLRFVDESLLRSLLATLLDTFPHVEAYEPFPGGGLLLLGGMEALEVELQAARGLAADPEEWRFMGIRTPEDILVSRLLTSEGVRALAAGAPLTTDQNNLLQTRSPKILRNPIGGKRTRALLAAHDPLLNLGPEADYLYYVRRLLLQKSAERARRLAASIRDPKTRRIAGAMLRIAAGRRAQGERQLAHLALEAGAGSVASHILLSMSRRQILAGRAPEPLRRLWEKDPLASAIIESWRLGGLRNPRGIRQLEETLEKVDPHSPLFNTATRLRIGWRQAMDDKESAKEALELLDPLLAIGHQDGRGLIQRTKLAIQAGDSDKAVASLVELAAYLERRPESEQAGAAKILFESLPPELRDHPRLAQALRQDADRPGRQGAAARHDSSGRARGL